MIWIFLILQIILVRIGWWVYHTYFTQPRYNHPRIFWNPVARFILEYGPTTGIIGLVVAGFFFTSHPWLFLLLTVIVLGFFSRNKNAQ